MRMAQSAAAQLTPDNDTAANDDISASSPRLAPDQQQQMARVLSMEQTRARRTTQTQPQGIQDAGAAGKDVLQQATGRVPLEQREDEAARAVGLAQSKQETAAGKKAGGVPGLNKAQQLAQGAKGPAQMLNSGRTMLGRLTGAIGGGLLQGGGQGVAGQAGKAAARQAVMMIVRTLIWMLGPIFSLLGSFFILIILLVILILAIEHGLETLGYEGFLDFF